MVVNKYLGTPTTFIDYIHKIHVVRDYSLIRDIINWLGNNAILCLKPQDYHLVQTIYRRFGIRLDIPKVMPNLNITPDDEILIMSYWRAPRRFDLTHVTTYDECLGETSFSFVVWKLDPIYQQQHTTDGNESIYTM